MTLERRATAGFAAPTINLASLVCGLDAYLRARGADAGEAMRRAGLDARDLVDPDQRVPLIRYLELLEICAELLADPQFLAEATSAKIDMEYIPPQTVLAGFNEMVTQPANVLEAMGKYLQPTE